MPLSLDLSVPVRERSRRPHARPCANAIARPPFRATALWPGAGHIVQPQDTYNNENRANRADHGSLYHPLEGNVNNALHSWEPIWNSA
jgi:hypothetical protein